jgi:hypothetical protein
MPRTRVSAICATVELVQAEADRVSADFRWRLGLAICSIVTLPDF